MSKAKAIGVNIERKEAWEKVTGKALYTGDVYSPGLLHARLSTATAAHARIMDIDTSQAQKIPGVKAILWGDHFSVLSGPLLQDRPPLAKGKVRYFGEPVAMVVALSEHEAALAAQLIKVTYEVLPVVGSALEAIAPDAPLLHEKLVDYKAVVKDIYPQEGTNIASSYHIRKGDMARGWAESQVIIEQCFSFPQSDHAAMETRISECEIMPNGDVHIITASQAPFTVREMVSRLFQIEEGKVHVHVPYVGGGFGGKAPVQMEILAYLASKAVGGRKVRLTGTREEDMAASPCRCGLEAKVKLGATKDGYLKAAELHYYLDTGAYSDIGPYMAKAIAVDSTGPYNIENLRCDALCVYTNHTFATSFRSFAHENYTFCIERALDMLALRCGIDPLQIRLQNAIAPGHFSPTQVEITASNTGHLEACLHKLKTLIGWEEGTRQDIGRHLIKAKGISCLWKSPNPPTDASSGALITFNGDGSLNLMTGVVEMGSGSHTHLVQLLAKKMKMDISRIHINPDVDTLKSPLHWKTVASMSGYLCGRAVLAAAEDVIAQLKGLAAVALRCSPDDLDIADEKVYVKHLPKQGIGFQDLVMGLKYEDGNTVGTQILGRGSFIMDHLTPLERDTGRGKTGSAWTVGAQAVEVELDTKEFTYRILKAATVMDIGTLINPHLAEDIIRGGMSMGLSLASREVFQYDAQCILQNTSLRNYKLLHIGQEPLYFVDFVQTPQEDAPFGSRAFSEHGLIGMPAALANALSMAAGMPVNHLPITPESLWQCSTKGGGYDSF